MNDLVNQLMFSLNGKKGALVKTKIHSGHTMIMVGENVEGTFNVIEYKDSAMIFCYPDKGFGYIKTSPVQSIESMVVVEDKLVITFKTETSIYTAIALLTEEEMSDIDDVEEKNARRAEEE